MSSTGTPSQSDDMQRPNVVLVVEDDALVRMMAVELLQDAGFDVVEAPDADVAWRMLERRDDIGGLFTDVDMPGSMNGFALARRVGRSWPHIRLVVASGRFAPGSKDMPEDGTFLSKPYSTRQVLRAFGA